MKHGRHVDAGALPQLEGLLVVAVERVERGLQLRRAGLSGSSSPALPRPFFGIVLRDVLPQVAEHRHLVAGDVVGDRHARQLDDAALDGVHQREVAHRPGEQRAFGVARAAQEERRGGQVDRRARRRACACTASRPEIHSRAASLFFSASFLSSPFRSSSSSASAASRGSSGAPRR